MVRTVQTHDECHRNVVGRRGPWTWRQQSLSPGAGAAVGPFQLPRLYKAGALEHPVLTFPRSNHEGQR